MVFVCNGSHSRKQPLIKTTINDMILMFLQSYKRQSLCCTDITAGQLHLVADRLFLILAYLCRYPVAHSYEIHLAF